MKATDAYRKINNSPIKGIVLYYTEQILQIDEVSLDSVIFQIQTGKTPPKANPRYYTSEDINWFKPSDIGYGKYLIEAKEKFSNIAVTEKKATIYPKDTLLMIGIGGGVGRVSILKEEGSSNQQITGINFIDDINPQYAYYYYLVREDYIKSRAKSMSFPILNQSKIKELDFKYPTLAEQNEFVKFIDACWNSFLNNETPDVAEFEVSIELKEYAIRQFEAIELDGKIQKNIKHELSLISQLKQSILQEAIQGKLTADWRATRQAQGQQIEPASELLKRIKAEKNQLIKDKKIKKEKALPPISEEEIPFELPEGWVWCRLGNLLLYSDAGKSPQCEKRPANYNEWGVLTTTAIQKGYFLEEANKVLPSNFEINLNQKVEKDDILITRAGPLNRTGISCKVDAINSNLILSDKTIRLKQVQNFISPDFIVTVLNSKSIRELLIPNMTGMAESQVNISQKNIKGTPFPLPTFEEQKAIVEKVEILMQNCQALEQEIETSEANAQMLMHAVLKEAFEGEKVVENV